MRIVILRLLSIVSAWERASPRKNPLNQPATVKSMPEYSEYQYPLKPDYHEKYPEKEKIKLCTSAAKFLDVTGKIS